ncbi:MAG: hypothetical protein GY898_01030 [Proteobacteria bacterium]|nr:hypothetical protein [Pseudomonadota bacterium]
MRGIALLAALLIGGCVTEAPPAAEILPVDLIPGAEGDLVPDDIAPDAGQRDRRRLDIAQLDASIRVATGGVGWTEFDNNGNEVNLFEELGATLGVPDWIERTTEDLTPSLVFSKFLGDAARDVCSTTIGRELALPNNPRTLMLHADEMQTWDEDPEAVRENLSYLLLRFHGRRIGPEDVALDPWTWLFQSTMHTGNSSAQAWTGICVALITHPDFYTL